VTEIAAPAETVQRQSALLPSLITGVVLSFTEIAFVISFASLIFSGELAVYLPRGLALAFVSAIIHSTVMAIFSGSQGMIPVIQDNPGVLLSVAAASVAANLAGADLLATTVALVAITTILSGGLFLFLGSMRLGGLVRYIPYPVVGGFLVGTGWLLAQGSIGAMASYSLSPETLPALLQPDQLLLWLPGALLGVILFFAMQRFQHIFVLPAVLIVWTALFFAVLLVSGTSIPEAQARGLLLGTVGMQVVWQPPVEIVQANWSAILGQAGNIGAILLLATIDLMLKFPAFELLFQRDIDSNRELRVAGFANVLAGLTGGMIGYAALSTSAISHRMRAHSRPVLIILALACASMLLLGTSLLAYLPKGLSGGILLAQGLDFLYTWVVQGRKKLGRLDYAVVLVILAVVATLGFLIGVVVGLILMIVLFVINYSRLNIFHSATSGVEITSHIERNTYHQRALKGLANQIYVMELQGFLFFGTANLVVDKVRTRLNESGDAPLSFLVLDFRRVTGLDSSAAVSFRKISDLAQTNGFTMVVTHLSETIRREFARNDLTAGKQLQTFADLDHGLEWCENTLLERDQITKMHVPSTLALQLADNGFAKDDTARLKGYLERVHFKPGDTLMRQGEDADALYFIEIGQVSVYLEIENNPSVRLHTLNMGTLVGEMGIYLNLPRSATVTADANTIAYRLKRQALEEMKSKDPALAIVFHELVVRLVAERLLAADREIIALHR
jgi:SulP family sulfate permease